MQPDVDADIVIARLDRRFGFVLEYPTPRAVLAAKVYYFESLGPCPLKDMALTDEVRQLYRDNGLDQMQYYQALIAVKDLKGE